MFRWESKALGAGGLLTAFGLTMNMVAGVAMAETASAAQFVSLYAIGGIIACIGLALVGTAMVSVGLRKLDDALKPKRE